MMKRVLLTRAVVLAVTAAALCWLSAPAGAEYWHTELTADEKTMALWHFNEGEGTVANDVAGWVNNVATLVDGASFVHVGVTDHGGLHPPADFGYALALDGTTGYAIIDDDWELEFPEAQCTTEFWIKPAAKSWQRILSKYTGQYRAWELVITHDSNLEAPDRFGDNAYHMYFRGGPGVESFEVRKVAATPIVPDQWQFVAMAFDVAGNPYVYINGVESALKSAWGVPADSIAEALLDAPLPLGIGAYDAGDTEPSRIISYEGLIDEVRISNADVVTGGPRIITDLGDLRGLAPGTLVKLEQAIVTRSLISSEGVPIRFYVEERDRHAGVRVNFGGLIVSPGDLMDILGTVQVYQTSEVYIDAVTADPVGSSTPVKPLAMQTKALAGEPLTDGLYNQGLLASITGKVTQVSDSFAEFWVDDGAAVDDGIGVPGVRVYSPRDPLTYQFVTPYADDFVTVTGVVGARAVNVQPRSYDLWVTPTGRLKARVGAESYPLGAEGLTSAGFIPMNAWSHVALVSDGATVRWWINGQPDTNTAEIQTPIVVGPVPLLIGALYNETPIWSGLIDEVRFSSVARTFSGAPLGPHTPDADTIALYHFDEGAGDLAANAASDPALDGQLAGVSMKPAWTEGRFGGALDFPGPTAYVPGPIQTSVLVQHNQAIGLENGVFTIEAWVYPRGGGYLRILSKYSGISWFLGAKPALWLGMPEDIQVR